MKMWIGAALLYLNSFPGLDKLKQLKDSHPSVAWTYKAFSFGTTQAGQNCDSLLDFNARNQVCKPLERRPGCDSATMQTRALSTYICFLLVFHKLLPRHGSDPILTKAHKGSRPALGAGRHPEPAWVKCYPLSRSSGLLPLRLKATLTSAFPPSLAGWPAPALAQRKLLKSNVTTHTGHDCHHPLAPWPLPPASRKSMPHLVPTFSFLRKPSGASLAQSTLVVNSSFGFHVYILVVVNLREAFYFRHTHTPTPSVGGGGKCDL